MLRFCCLFLAALLLLLLSSPALSFTPSYLPPTSFTNSAFGSRRSRSVSSASSPSSTSLCATVPPFDSSLDVALDAGDVLMAVAKTFVGTPLILLVPITAAAGEERAREACELKRHFCMGYNDSAINVRVHNVVADVNSNPATYDVITQPPSLPHRFARRRCGLCDSTVY